MQTPDTGGRTDFVHWGRQSQKQMKLLMAALSEPVLTLGGESDRNSHVALPLEKM